jgi:hypothetical protein
MVDRVGVIVEPEPVLVDKVEHNGITYYIYKRPGVKLFDYPYAIYRGSIEYNDLFQVTMTRRGTRREIRKYAP